MFPVRPLRIRPLLLAGTTAVALAASCAGESVGAAEPALTAEHLQFFEAEVRPLLAEHCYSCHSGRAEKLQAGLRLDSRQGLLEGGDSGAAIAPGDADASLLIESVRYEAYEMPPKGKLPPEDIQTLERWVKMGAPWPEESPPTASVSPPAFDLHGRKSGHWVWQPVRAPQVPLVVDKEWPRSELDHFVLARLEQEHLRPAGDADRAALARRLYFDLVGLPPTPEQVAAFVADTDPQATERLVDELLDSPHFGERWGRHWLDLVRYAESRGHEFDNDAPNAYQYRDYIIRALNADIPYDQLIREHIAGDLLRSPRLNPEKGFNESILGTGFWFLGEWGHSPVDIRKDEADRFDNMIDVMSKTFLGITVSCARCHDHKFDAVSTADYYSLIGFLQSSDYRQVRFESLEHNRGVADRLSELDTRYKRLIDEQLHQMGIGAPALPPISEAAASFVVVDYSTLEADEYIQDGFIFGARPRRAGDAYLETVDGQPALRFAAGGAAASDAFWNGLESVSERGMQNQSALANLPRSGRTLRTPTFALTSGNVACRVRGEGHIVACVDSHRMIAGPLHGQTVKSFKAGEEWIELDLERYIGHRIHLEFTPAEGAQLEISLVTQGATPEARGELQEYEASVAFAVEAMVRSTARVLTENDSSAEHLRHLIRSWADERVALQTQIKRRSRLAMAMLDGTGEDAHVMIRGDASKPGDLAPRGFLAVLSGGRPMHIESGSGRLQLAARINSPDNPLTYRVIVNRLWHHLLGRGLVPTTDDFGVLGERPTHPELLDFLADRFTRDGQSIKRMIRYIVLSRTYQMSSAADASAIAADPENLLWHHCPPKRLQGEAIRDALLALSGRLDTSQFGEPVPVHLTSFMEGRGRPSRSGPLDGDGRRSIYCAIRRNFLSPFMLAFDAPVPFSTMGRRNVSNVPAQALILMNDPFVIEQARQWAERALRRGETAEARIEWMYWAALARQPTGRETAAAVDFVTDQAMQRGVPQSDPQVWADFAHALVNAKEFIFLR